MSAIELPLQSIRRAYHRVIVKPVEHDWSGKWDVLPTPAYFEMGAVISKSGYRVTRYSRRTLPSIGEAEIRYDFGAIDQREFTARNLMGYDIRIQALQGSDSLERTVDFIGGTWRTVWWGVVEYQDDDLEEGVRVYRAIDGLASRARKWVLDKHAYYFNGSGRICSGGHPGYNRQGSDGRVVGDRESTGITSTAIDGDELGDYLAHTYPGLGKTWTDQQALEHAIALHRTSGDPDLSFAGTTELLGGSQAWGVTPGDTAWNLFQRIGDRRRGRGLIYTDYSDDSGDPTGILTVNLKVSAQTLDDQDYTAPSGASVSLPGAESGSTTRAVNLFGDQRLRPGSLKIGERHEHTADRVEVSGEPIQVLVTLSYADGVLEKRWTDAEATALAAISDTDPKLANRWSHVFRLHGLPRGWSGVAGDGEGGTPSRADYRMRPTGGIKVPSGNTFDSNPAMVRILRDLPIYGGVDYSSSSPSRYDADSDTADLHRERMKLFAYDGSAWTDLKTDKITAQVTSDGIMVYAGTDLKDGNRAIGDTAESNLGSAHDVSELVVTVGLQLLQHRMQMTDGRSRELSRRTVRISIPDLHLWLAHPGAIWTMDPSDGSITRNAAGATASSPGILRDDRDRLARVLNLASGWYLTERRGLTYTMSCMGLLDDLDGDTTYPALGEVVTSAAYSDRNREESTATINTPVTEISVDVERGTTTWKTDWQELTL